MNKVKEYLKKTPFYSVVIGGKIIDSPVSVTPFGSIEGIIDGKVADIINFLVGFSVVVAVILIIASGYMFITAAGDPEKIEKGQKALTAALIGMAIVFLARTLVVFFLTQIMGT